MIRIFVKITILCLVTAFSAAAQETQQIKQDGDSLYTRRTPQGEITWIIGNVIITHNETTIYSDSAIFYKAPNQIEFYDNVRITDGDSINITADKLYYDGNKKIARLREKVVFRKLNRATLYTDNLDYFRMLQEARYFSGGRLVDSTNTLTSVKGYYQVNTNMASFKNDVVLVNPDYTLKSDTLQYHTRTNIVYFRGPTEIIDADGSVVHLEQGEYDTRIKRSELRIGEVETISYKITGDRMSSDDVSKVASAKGNVIILGKDNDVIITGGDSRYDKKKGVIRIFGDPVMKKIMENDTLYLSADTLMAIEHEDPSRERLLAFHNVKIFKSDLQGRADSMAYFTADSLLEFYRDPVLWTGVNQMTADSIQVFIRNSTIDKMLMRLNSFVVSEDSLQNHNQIKGRNMTAYFKDRQMHHVDVLGNAESLFYALDNTNTQLVGVNKSISSNMRINFKSNRADNISFYVEPAADFIPPHELQAAQKRLQGFQWHGDQRPTKAEVLHLKPTPRTEDPDENSTVND